MRWRVVSCLVLCALMSEWVSVPIQLTNEGWDTGDMRKPKDETPGIFVRLVSENPG